MNTLRQPITNSSWIPRSRSCNAASAVANHRSNESNLNTSHFAWQYWRRANHGYSSARWNPLRLSQHTYTATTYRDEDANAPYTQLTKNGFSLRPYTSSASLCLPSNYYATSMTIMPSCLVGYHRGSNLPYHLGSNFSTMHKHSTSTNSSNKETKQNKEEDGQRKQIDESQLTAKQRAKILFKKYGTVFVGTYFGIYFATLFSFFVALDFNLVDPDTLSQIFKVSKDMACETADIIGPTGTGASMNEAADAYAEDVKAETISDSRTLVDIITGYLQNWNFTSRYAEKMSENPHLANLAVAWFMVKFTEPVRLAGAVIVTPKVAKALGRKEAKVDVEKML